MQIQPYIFFDGRCEDAIEFYRGALGAEVTTLLRFKEHPDPQERGKMPPGMGDKVMHASIRIGETTLLASDGRGGGHPTFQGFSLTVLVRDEAEAGRVFASLADGGRCSNR